MIKYYSIKYWEGANTSGRDVKLLLFETNQFFFFAPHSQMENKSLILPYSMDLFSAYCDILPITWKNCSLCLVIIPVIL